MHLNKRGAVLGVNFLSCIRCHRRKSSSPFEQLIKTLYRQMKQSNQQKSVAIKPKVFFPIYTPLHFEKVSYEELHNSLKEIEAMSGSIKFNIWGAKSDPAEIRLILPEDSKDFFPIEESNLRLTLPYFVLSFSQQVTLSDFFVECSDPEAKELPLQ